ncbi:MAG: hypothetical protein JNM88_16160 [Chitinophagaceae bacterium]|nr:hypothetical protein [Chitinophagaceae bacterium]
MSGLNKNLVLLFKDGFGSEGDREQEVKALNQMLKTADSPEQFCIANELLNRNHITSNPRRILKEAAHFRLRPFRFFINKN